MRERRRAVNASLAVAGTRSNARCSEVVRDAFCHTINYQVEALLGNAFVVERHRRQAIGHYLIVDGYVVCCYAFAQIVIDDVITIAGRLRACLEVSAFQRRMGPGGSEKFSLDQARS